jgi:hypothetical protein
MLYVGSHSPPDKSGTTPLQLKCTSLSNMDLQLDWNMMHEFSRKSTLHVIICTACIYFRNGSLLHVQKNRLFIYLMVSIDAAERTGMTPISKY